jgi:hypothetical protein
MKDYQYQATGEASSPQKRTSRTTKQHISSLFTFLWPFLSDPYPADLDQCGMIRADPDP